MTLNNGVRWLIASMLVTALLFTGMSPTKICAAPSWPADGSWVVMNSIEDDDNCPSTPFRDVRYVYYQCDSEYLYLRMQTETCPEFLLGNKDPRYKWFLDVGASPLQSIQGGNVINSDYLLFLEDTNNDNTGEVYLLSPPYPNWKAPFPLPAGSDTAGYRFVCPSPPGPGFIDMYVKFSAIGVSNCYQVSLIWVTDNEDQNLQAAPECDKQDQDGAYVLNGSITIIKNAVPDDAQDFSFLGDLGSFVLDDDTDSTYPNTVTFNNLLPRTYNVTESVPICWTPSISGAPSTGNTANIGLSPGGNITVTFTNTLTPMAPTVESIDIYRASDDQVIDSMTPQTPYYAKVRFISCSYLSYLKTVQVTLFYNDGSHPNAPTSGDTQTCAILTWTASPEGWSISPSGGYPTTTWSLDSSSCSRPADLNVLAGEWKFYFTPGKVATEAPSMTNPVAHWDVQATATDQLNQTGELHIRNKTMNWYGEVTVTGTADWGEVPLGLKFEDAPNPETVSVNYIANGDYYEEVESSATWQNPPAPATPTETVILDTDGNNPPGTSKFSLKADNTAVYSGDAIVVTSTEYRQINASGSLTGETGVTNNNNGLWLSLGEDNIALVTYSGTIYYQISDR